MTSSVSSKSSEISLSAPVVLESPLSPKATPQLAACRHHIHYPPGGIRIGSPELAATNMELVLRSSPTTTTKRNHLFRLPIPRRLHQQSNPKIIRIPCLTPLPTSRPIPTERSTQHTRKNANPTRIFPPNLGIYLAHCAASNHLLQTQTQIQQHLSLSLPVPTYCSYRTPPHG